MVAELPRPLGAGRARADGLPNALSADQLSTNHLAADQLPADQLPTDHRSAEGAPFDLLPTDGGEAPATGGTMRDFDEFYRQHRDEIGRALVFVLGDRALGQEAVDEAMVKAYQQWDQLGATHNPAGWVFVVGKRWGLSWRRWRRREQNRERMLAARDGRLAETEPVDRMSADSVDLLSALGELTVEQRTVVVCRFSLGLSVRETAELLDIREGTVKSRLARSVDRLRELTQEDTWDGEAR